MMTIEILRREMAVSEANEEATYRNLTLDLFRGIQESVKVLYDQTRTATKNFTAIKSDILIANPKIVKTLRYCLAPVISQMRLGQIIKLSTTDRFEEKGFPPTKEQAEWLAKWFNDNLDRERFQWLDRPKMSAAEKGIAETYAKLWTVSLQSNQNTLTEYRTRRKEAEEKAIADALDGMNLKFQQQIGVLGAKSSRRKRGDPTPSPTPKRLGGIDQVEDVQPGHYVKEKKILGKSEKKQKADLIVRPSGVVKLFCIEAKAVGIRLDSSKRLKELNDKYTDWEKSLLPITTVGVIAGMFNATELMASIRGRHIPIFFEHNLDMLVEFLQSGTYYGSVWKPEELFNEVPPGELNEAMEAIKDASLNDRADGESAS